MTTRENSEVVLGDGKTREFGLFLRAKRPGLGRRREFFLMWASRFAKYCELRGRTPSTEAVQPFLEELSREKAPWQVDQAQEAVRLFVYFLSSRFGTSTGLSTGVSPAPSPPSSAFRWAEAMEEMSRVMRVQHLSLRTERIYLAWIRRFMTFAKPQGPGRPEERLVGQFVSQLAVEGFVTASTQNQAFCALLFFFRHVLRQDIRELGESVRARRRRRLPVVLAREEVRQVLGALAAPYGLMARFLYGSGLRLQECLELRIKDVDFEQGLVTVRSGKGDKDRRTILPESLRDEWTQHLQGVRALYGTDRAQGLP